MKPWMSAAPFDPSACDNPLARSREQSGFTVTRLRAGPGPLERVTVFPTDDALLVSVSLTPAAVGQWRAGNNGQETRRNGKEVAVTRSMAFATTVLDLSRPMEMRTRGPFDYLHFRLPASLLRKVALENEVSTAYELRESFAVADLVVAQLTRSILCLLRQGARLDRLELDELALVLSAHVLQKYCGFTAPVAGSKWRGLQTWQKLRAGKCTVSEDPVFGFGSFRFLPRQQLLLRAGQPVKLGCRAMDVLHLLLKSAGEPVSKRVLQKFVWPDTVVHDSNLKVHVHSLRRALGETSPRPTYICTVAGRGYRFIAPVSLEPISPSSRAIGAASAVRSG